MNQKILATALAASLALAATAAAAAADTAPTDVELSDVLVQTTHALSTYVAVLAGTSGLAVALLEAFKKLFSVRGRFHRAAVIRWLAQDEASIPASLKPATEGPLTALNDVVSLGRSPHYAVLPTRKAQLPAAAARVVGGTDGTPFLYDPAGAYAEFFHLTSGQKLMNPPTPRSDWLHWRGLDRAVFELEIARMMSQIQDAADTVLNNPALYPNLYAFFTRGCRPDDAAAWPTYLATLERSDATAATKATSDLYGRIRLLMRRQLDAFQGVTSNRWDDLNQLWAVLVGAVILMYALLVMQAHGEAGAPLLPWADLAAGFSAAWTDGLMFGLVVKAAFGGALAPIAKDLLSSLSSLKFSK